MPCIPCPLTAGVLKALNSTPGTRHVAREAEKPKCPFCAWAQVPFLPKIPHPVPLTPFVERPDGRGLLPTGTATAQPPPEGTNLLRFSLRRAPLTYRADGGNCSRQKAYISPARGEIARSRRRQQHGTAPSRSARTPRSIPAPSAALCSRLSAAPRRSPSAHPRTSEPGPARPQNGGAAVPQRHSRYLRCGREAPLCAALPVPTEQLPPPALRCRPRSCAPRAADAPPSSPPPSCRGGGGKGPQDEGFESPPPPWAVRAVLLPLL